MLLLKILDIQTNSFGISTVCTGGNSCCTKQNPCSQWEGDCDNDDQCKDELICGHNNCPNKKGLEWDLFDDCCTFGNQFTITFIVFMLSFFF